ncbi:MAG: glutamine--fructose-6-phosphate aminotransferase, partial [Myxococcota bacterium]|nr:glutamine--fructose-6-phosphate aminotransferase [Myxococcota bacterium]
MCGVIGFVSARHREDLGLLSARLLKTLEYRGYDSTGAAIQGEGEEVTLRKGVGAPSVMVERLGITGLAGSIMCGQVRWATFGSVDELNAQPHELRCRAHLYGAHNGNVTNCDNLKTGL